MSETLRSGSSRHSVSYSAKIALVRISLLALGAGFERVSAASAALRAEIASWEEGRIFALGMWPSGPAVSFCRKGDRIRFLGWGDGAASLRLLFKNVDDALLPLLGQIGPHTAFIENRAILHGSIAEAMQISRALIMVQSHLLPCWVLSNILKRPPRQGLRMRLLKTWLLITSPGAMLIRAFRRASMSTEG